MSPNPPCSPPLWHMWGIVKCAWQCVHCLVLLDVHAMRNQKLNIWGCVTIRYFNRFMYMQITMSEKKTQKKISSRWAIFSSCLHCFYSHRNKPHNLLHDASNVMSYTWLDEWIVPNFGWTNNNKYCNVDLSIWETKTTFVTFLWVCHECLWAQSQHVWAHPEHVWAHPECVWAHPECA